MIFYWLCKKSNISNSAELDFMNFQLNYSELKNYKDIAGQIKYSEIIKQFPHLIKSQKGRYGGTWAELYVLLKIASMLDKDLELSQIKINNKPLQIPNHIKHLLTTKTIERAKTKHNFIYLITDGEFLKIGIAKDVKSRLAKLQTGNARELKIIFQKEIKNPNQLEKFLHSKYKSKNIRGEWFDLLHDKNDVISIINNCEQPHNNQLTNKKEHNSLIQEKRTEYQKDLQKFIQVGFVKNIDALNKLD